MSKYYFTAGNQFLRYGGQASLFFLIAKYFNAEDFGRFMVAFTFAMVASIAFDYGLQVKALIDIPGEKRGPEKFISESVLIKLLLFALVLPSCVALTGFTLFEDKVNLIAWLLLSGVFYSFANLFGAINRACGRFDYEFFANLVHYICLFSVLIFLVMTGADIEHIAMAFFYSRALFSFVSFLMIYSFIIRKNSITLPSSKELRAHFLEGMPFAIITGLSILYVNYDTFIINHFLGDVAVGTYQAGFRLMLASMIVPEIVVAANLPALSKQFREDSALFKNTFHKVHFALIFLGLVCSFSFLFLGEKIIIYFFEESYRAGISLIPLLSVILFLRFHGAATGMLLFVFDRQKSRMMWMAIMFCLGVGLNLFLIPKFGLIGAVYSSLIAHVGLNLFYIYGAIIGWKTGLLTDNTNPVPVGNK